MEYQRLTWVQKPEDTRKQIRRWKPGQPKQHQCRVLSPAEPEELTRTTLTTAREPNPRGVRRGKEKVKQQKSWMS